MKRLPVGHLITGEEAYLCLEFGPVETGLERLMTDPEVVINGGVVVLTGRDADEAPCVRIGRDAVPSARPLRGECLTFLGVLTRDLSPYGEQSLTDLHPETPLLVSSLDSYTLKSRLQLLIRELFYGVFMVHGALIAVEGRGVLLMGEAGVGKTSLAIALADRGHGWAADDAVVLEEREEGGVVGSSHGSVKGMIHDRQRGIMMVVDRLPVAAVLDRVPVHLILLLKRVEKGNKRNVRAMPCPLRGLSIPTFLWPVREDPDGEARSIERFVRYGAGQDRF